MSFGRSSCEFSGTSLRDLAQDSGRHVVVHLLHPDVSSSSALSTLSYLLSSKSSSSTTLPLYHLLPDTAIASAHHVLDPGTHRCDPLKSLALIIYDRIERVVARFVPKPLISPPPSPLRAPASLPEPEKAFFHSPAFRLGVRLGINEAKDVQFSLEWPSKTLDILDRHRFLHVGYALSEDKAWLFIVGFDGLAEGHSVKVIATPRSKADNGVDLQGVVSAVWSVAKQVVNATSVEWRIAIGKLGVMEAKECLGMYTL
jgi:mediator of RNA polymerase II transcription subunit 13